jgi:hypothetical protein
MSAATGVLGAFAKGWGALKLGWGAKLGLGAAAAAGGTGSVFAAIKRKFPALIEPHPVGHGIEVDGEHHVVIGYFGAAAETIENVDHARDLYFGSYQEAQGYALRRAKEGQQQKPAVGVVLASRFPAAEHYAPTRYEIHPLSPKGQAALKVKVRHFTHVTPHTRVGLFGTVQRLQIALKADGVKALFPKQKNK